MLEAAKLSESLEIDGRPSRYFVCAVSWQPCFLFLMEFECRHKRLCGALQLWTRPLFLGAKWHRLTWSRVEPSQRGRGLARAGPTQGPHPKLCCWYQTLSQQLTPLKWVSLCFKPVYFPIECLSTCRSLCRSSHSNKTNFRDHLQNFTTQFQLHCGYTVTFFYYFC